MVHGPPKTLFPLVQSLPPFLPSSQLHSINYEMRVASHPLLSFRRPPCRLIRRFSSALNIQAQHDASKNDNDGSEQYKDLSGPSITFYRSQVKKETILQPEFDIKTLKLDKPPDSDIKLDLNPAQDASSSRCRNRGVVLTGGTGGIGFAIAKRLVEEGAGRVVIISRDAQRANEAIAKIKQQSNLHDAPLSPFVADITQPETNNITQLMDHFSYCNTLINCAGIPEYRSMLKSTIAKRHEIINTNLDAPIELSKQFLSHYVQSRKRRNAISAPQRSAGFDENAAQSYCAINVSSLLAYKAVIGTADYAAAKAGLIAHTRALALEGSRYQDMAGDRSPFRANVVVPGYVDTAMVSSFSSGVRQSIEDDIPLHRFGRPEEVADAIVFLIANEYANNCVLNLDGGLSAS